MRLPRKKKKEMKKAFSSISMHDIIHKKPHLLLRIMRCVLKEQPEVITGSYGRRYILDSAK